MKKRFLAVMIATMLASTTMVAPVYATDFDLEIEDVDFADDTTSINTEENTDVEVDESVDEFSSIDSEDSEGTSVAKDAEDITFESENVSEKEDDFELSDDFSDGTITAEELADTFAAGSTSDNSIPYSSVDKLENGTYTVTANVYVPGELNKVLVNTNAFLTNPKYPFGTGSDYGTPTTAMKYNAELVVNNNDITVKLELRNPVFQALQINDGSNIEVIDKTYNDELSNSEIHTKYGKKIQTVTFKLKDYSGLYSLENCKEFASILYTEGDSTTEADAVWDVPLNLAVDFQGIGKEEKEVVNTFFAPDLQIAMLTRKDLPDGVTADMREITADSTGEDGEKYKEALTFFNNNSLNKENNGFRMYYVGMKDASGNPINDMEKYAPTLYSQVDCFFVGSDMSQPQGMMRLEDGNVKKNEMHLSVGDTSADLADFDEGDDEYPWYDTYSWETNEFSGGYIIIYDVDAKLSFKYHMSDSNNGIGMNYYGTRGSGTKHTVSQEDEAQIYYRLKTAENKRGTGDKTLENLLKEKSGYTNVNMNTYQAAIYSLATDPSSGKIVYLGRDETKLELELPVGKKSDFKIYEIVYDKATSQYISVNEVSDYEIQDEKADITIFPVEGFYETKAEIAQRLYGAVADDEYTGSEAGSQIQYYAIVSEGAVADKPSVSNATFTYDGTEKSLIPENQYYTVSGDVSKKLPGSYKVTVTLKDGYAWKDGTTDPIEFTWNIKALQTKKPVAVSGLTYNGKNQAGVKAGKGYNLAGTYTAKNVGSYKAKVLLAEGYEWSDGTTDPLTLTWSINKAGQTVKTKVTTKNYTFTSLKKKAVSFTIGASGQGTISYKVVKAPSKASKYIAVDKKGKVTVKKGAKIGTYVVRVSAAGNSNYKAATKDVTVKVTKLTQKITAKVSGKTYKAASLKKKAAAFSIGAKAKTSVSYKVVKAPSKASKYISVSKSGKVTMKKKAPKGTYEIRVTAKANGTYNASTKTIKVVVK